MFTGWLYSSETEDPRTQICCHPSPTPFTNQPPVNSECTCTSTSKEALTFFTWLSITTSLSCPKKEIVRDFWNSTTVILSSSKVEHSPKSKSGFPSHWIWEKPWLQLLKVQEAFIQNLTVGHFFLSVQTNHSCPKERPRITTSMIPLPCCFFVCAHRNTIWVAMTLPHINTAAFWYPPTGPLAPGSPGGPGIPLEPCSPVSK